MSIATLTTANTIPQMMSTVNAAVNLANLWDATATTVASATTTNIGTPGVARVDISGSATITSLGTSANRIVFVKFTGAAVLTHNATTLVLPSGANITAAAGDTAIFISDGSGNWTCLQFQRATGKSLVTSVTASDISAAVLAALAFGPFTTLASATTTNLSSIGTVGISVTGTTTITSFGTGANLLRIIKFAAALTLTHNGTSLILPGGANITTAAGDTAVMLSDGSGNWTCVSYQKASGKAVVTSITSADIAAAVLAALAFGPFTSIASGGTTDLSTVASVGANITGTTTITSLGSGANLLRVVKFAGALTLTHNATSLILPTGANITTAAGDTAMFMSDGSGNWTCVYYQRASGAPLTFTIGAGTVTFAMLASAALATTAQYLNNTASLVLTTDKAWAAAAPVALTDAATVAVDMNSGINFSLTLGGNRTMGAPSNTKNGQSGCFLIKQDGTGSRTLSWNSVYKWPAGTAPTLTTTASAVDKVYYYIEDSTHIHCSCEKDSK